jgi:hypothetical protein
VLSKHQPTDPPARESDAGESAPNQSATHPVRIDAHRGAIKDRYLSAEPPAPDGLLRGLFA